MNAKFGKPGPGKEYFEGLGAEAAWLEISKWVTDKARKKDTPTIEEVIAYYNNVAATKPAPKVETSDIKETYAVTKGCALQALINFKGSVLGKDTAEDLHDHIWATEDLAAYKEYDINWPALYTSQGITMNETNKNTKAGEMPEGKFICEVKGHMMVVSRAARAREASLVQDPGNAIGAKTDRIIQSFKQA